MRVLLRIASAAVAIATLAIVTGCAKHLQSIAGLPNQPPTVSLTGAPLEAVKAERVAYALRWSGSDPDGRVDHYLVTDNPRLFAGTQGWARADETARVLALGRVGPASVAAPNKLPEPTFFAVRAVDDQGAVSEPAIQAFIGTNVAPSVKFVSPLPSHLMAAMVPPTIRVQWQGYDPDGADPYKLASYRYKLIPEGDPDYAAAITDPDSLRRKYAPDFSSWDLAPPDTVWHTFTGLTANANYVLALVAFDEQGAYSPVFSLDTNLLRMHVLPPGTGGPRFTVSGDSFIHQFMSGGFFADTAQALPIDIVGSSVTVHWRADEVLNSLVEGYRWAIDIGDPLDQTPRLNPGDVRHWSEWRQIPDSALVSTRFPEPHSTRRFLYVEAIENNGFVSLIIVRLDFQRPSFTQPLLIVNDTRRIPEIMLGGQVRPTGLWPNVAELDSFLFARGNVPIQGYPAGSMSSPGVFSGYGFDVFETSSLPPGNWTVPLDLLTRYRNVVWITDQAGAVNRTPPGGSTSLRWMSNPARQNTLAAYVGGGGRLWIAGGGAALASSVDMFNSTRNDDQQFVYAYLFAELQHGSFMYEVPRWQSELRTFKTGASLPALSASLGAMGPAGLPAALEIRSPATDPVPPLRTPNQFYPNSSVTDIEYLSLPNSIVGGGREPNGRGRLTGRGQAMNAGHGGDGGDGHGDDDDHGHGGGHGQQYSLLDTLYTCRGLSPDFNADYPCMTVYRGPGSGQVVFTGFDLWTWKRSQVVAMINAIVGDLWHQAPAMAGFPRGDDGEKATGDLVKRRK